jgi:hypothetical protein
VGKRTGRGSRSIREKSAPVVICSKVPPNVGSNPGRRGGKPVTNRLIYSKALLLYQKKLLSLLLLLPPLVILPSKLAQMVTLLTRNLGKPSLNLSHDN